MRPRVSALREHSVGVRAPPNGARAEPLARLQAADGGVSDAGAPVGASALAPDAPALRRVPRGARALAASVQLLLSGPSPLQEVRPFGWNALV